VLFVEVDASDQSSRPQEGSAAKHVVL